MDNKDLLKLTFDIEHNNKKYKINMNKMMYILNDFDERYVFILFAGIHKIKKPIKIFQLKDQIVALIEVKRLLKKDNKFVNGYLRETFQLNKEKVDEILK